MTETRWQIAAFAVLAAGLEVIASLDSGSRTSAIRGTLNAAAAAIVIISVKFHLEPAARRHDSGIIHHVANTVINAAADTQ